MGVLIDIYHAYKLKEVNKLWKYRLSKFINKISLWLATDVNWSLLHTEKWKVAESMRHLFEWHFIPHTLSPETREGGDPSRTRFQIDCVHAHTLAPGSPAARLLILLPIGWWSGPAVSKDERPHLSIPIGRIKSTRSIAHKASDVASPSLPTACMQGIISLLNPAYE